MICFREIQSGRSPLDAVPDFEIAIDDAHIERRDGYLWLCGEDGLHDRDAARRQLLVYALSEMERWALTLHGIWRFLLSSNEPVANDHEPEERGPMLC
jgi:hypothetical protein